MDEQDIATAILSVSAPGVQLDPSGRGDAEARATAGIAVTYFTSQLDAYEDAGRAGVDRDNAEALFPRLATR